MYKRVLILGGTGFLGYYVLRALYKADFDMAILLHRKKDDLNVPFEGYALFEGDILKPETLKSTIDKFKPDVIIDMVGSFKTDPKKIFIEATKNLLKAAQEGGVKKIVYVSDLAVNLNKKNAYLEARRGAENELRNSIFLWTIFRSSVIFGWRANFTNTIKIYEAVGPEILTPKEIVNRLKSSLNSERKILYVPFFILKVFSFFKKVGFPTHISSSYIQVFKNRALGNAEYLKRDFDLNEIKFDPAQDHELY